VSLTKESVDAGIKAYRNMGLMVDDFVSGDPDSQASVFGHFLKHSREAVADGRVASDPVPSAAKTFLNLLESTHKDLYREIAEAPAIEGMLDRLYPEAKQRAAQGGEGSEDLLLSLQHVEKALYGKYRKAEDIKAADPLSKKEAELTEREQRLEGRDRQERFTAWKSYLTSTTQSVDDTVSTVVNSVLDKAREALKDAPDLDDRLANIEARVSREIQKAVKSSDSVWSRDNEQLLSRARNARSEEVRNSIRKDLVSRYEQKAKRIAAELEPKLISSEVKATASKSKARHDRAERGKRKKASRASGSTVKPKISGKEPSGAVNSAGWSKAVDEIFVPN
jgi:hypothetical protein